MSRVYCVVYGCLNCNLSIPAADFERIGTMFYEIVVWTEPWWVGFVMSLLLWLIIALPLLIFPEETIVKREKRRPKASKAEELAESMPLGLGEKEPRSLTKFMSIPSFVCLNLAGGMDGILVAELAAILPMVFDTMYSRNASAAGTLLGTTILVAGGSGTFIGGWFLKRWVLTCTSVIKLCIAATFMATLFCFSLFLKCNDNPFSDLENLFSGDFSSRRAITRELLDQNCYLGIDCPCLWFFVTLFHGLLFFTFIATIPTMAATIRCIYDYPSCRSLNLKWVKYRPLIVAPLPFAFRMVSNWFCPEWTDHCKGVDPFPSCMANKIFFTRKLLVRAVVLKLSVLGFLCLALYFFRKGLTAKKRGNVLAASNNRAICA